MTNLELHRSGPIAAPDPIAAPGPRPGAATAFLADVTPNWFASVMGTGIVATSAATLPDRAGIPAGAWRVGATVVWLGAAGWLTVLTVAFVLHWVRFPDRARAHAAHPVTGQFYGAPAMALLTVGAGTELLGGPVLGTAAAWWCFVVLWCAGTVAGLATSVTIPYRMITGQDRTGESRIGRSGADRGRPEQDRSGVAALPVWLMPVVPPMVSASTGSLLIPHLPAGQVRLTVLLACYAMFGLSLGIGLITIALVYGRLVHDGPPPVQAAPTVWILLGMIGQSVTAANLLAARAPLVLPAPTAGALAAIGIVYGLAMGGFGVLVLTLAAALTLHAARRGLTFSLTWWSFTFPVGTCVTGLSAVARATGAIALADLSLLMFAGLVLAWVVVAARTAHGLRTATLLAPR